MFASLLAGLAVAEVALAVDGRYNSVLSRGLVSSPAIWEPLANATEHEQYPDLGLQVEIRFDSEGVRNHGSVRTHRKPQIIGVFGDSFTENRRIDDQFTFTSVLDGIARRPVRVVNCGVDGYGLDQALKLLRTFDGRVIYLRQNFSEEMDTFVKDGHWNEYGNLQMASVLAGLDSLPFHGAITRLGL